MRTPIIAGNWKMHTELSGALELASDVRRLTEQVRSVEVALIPPFPFLDAVRKRLEGSRVKLGAQDCHQEEKGAYTGAISIGMLSSVGCHYVLAGHSERRTVFGDDDQTVNQKLRSILTGGLHPILCIGETAEERTSGQTEEVIQRQLVEGLFGVTGNEMANVVIAYEPVWAIGTGETATPGQAQDVHAFIRQLLERAYDLNVSQETRIQYGGSVKPDNVDELMGCPDIDGALVGGASLKADSFTRIVKFNK
jgi:triosephosphate isomerase